MDKKPIRSHRELEVYQMAFEATMRILLEPKLALEKPKQALDSVLN